jgi:hypothetical protein
LRHSQPDRQRAAADALRLSVVKRFRLSGRTNAEFRVEMLNAFNQPYFMPDQTGQTATGFSTSRPAAYEGAGDSARQRDHVHGGRFPSERSARRQRSRVIQLVWRVSW